MLTDLFISYVLTCPSVIVSLQRCTISARSCDERYNLTLLSPHTFTSVLQGITSFIGKQRDMQ